MRRHVLHAHLAAMSAPRPSQISAHRSRRRTGAHRSASGAQLAQLGDGVNSAVADLRRQRPPAAALVYSRAMTQHLCPNDTMRVLANIGASGAQFAMLRTYPFFVNEQVATWGRKPCDSDMDSDFGSWPEQNLGLPPYSLAPPVRLYNEQEPLPPQPGHPRWQQGSISRDPRNQVYLRLWRLPFRF